MYYLGMQPTDAPKTTGKPPVELTLTGCLMPWLSSEARSGPGEGPVLLRMPGSELEYLPVFTSVAKLRACLGQAGVTFDSVKQITDGRTFLDSLPPDVVVIHDPWYTSQSSGARVRFQQIQRVEPN